MRVDVSTICTADHFQHYIPMYAYCLQKAYPDWRVCIGVMGELDQLTRDACAHLPNCQIREGTEPPQDHGIVISQLIGTKIPLKESTSNTMRFLFFMREPNDDYDLRRPDLDYILITDVDFLFFQTPVSPLDWCRHRMEAMNTCYYAHHGPWKKPRRFEGGWRGDRERLSGGVVLLTPDWFKATKGARAKYAKLLTEGKIGTYREEDEVVLCKIMKESGLPITTSKFCEPMIRGLHLGDFKETMGHRWTNMAKMREKLAVYNIGKFTEMCRTDGTWAKIEREVSKDPLIAQIFVNVRKHIQEREGVNAV